MRTIRLTAAALTVAAGTALGTQYLLGATSHAGDAPGSATTRPVASSTTVASPSTTRPAASTSSASTAATSDSGTASASTSSLRVALGSDGSDVSTLQQRLVRLGLLSVQPTGHYGSATQVAVATFDRSHGIAVQQGVDQLTWVAIRDAAAGAPASSTTPSATSPASSTPSAAATSSASSAATSQGTSASQLDPRCQTGRVLCVSKRSMRLYWVVDGQVQDSFSVRVGMPAHPTPEFSVYRMERNSWSHLYHVNMPYAMYFSGGEAVHYSAQFASTGYGDGSHGCVNLRDYNGIAWLYSQVHLGDKVVVYS